MSKSKSLTGAVLPFAAIAIAGVAAYPHLSARLQGAAARAPAKAPIAASIDGVRAEAGSGPGSYDIGGLSGQPSIVPKAGVAAGRGTYIVTFRDPPLASYRGGVPGIAVPKRAVSPGGRLRLDVKSAEANAYVDHLRRGQARAEREIARMIGAPLPVRSRMQHALNAIVVDMTAAQAARVARMPGVSSVEPERLLTLSTDIGPTLIGAPVVWNGSNPGAPGPYQGEGMVVGIVDTGINFGSPSFAAVDPIDGYTHANPFGAGVFVGTCASGGVDQGRCNNKLIGGYDFVCGPPANQCGQPNIREEPGFGDTNGHGSHVASTSAGNRRDAAYSGATIRISGVAPRANIIAYDTCYSLTTGGGSCPLSSTAAAINQSIADGVVDAINYSIAGGSSPWSDSVSQAMLNAVNAGIFVAAAAGNDGPNANTLDHSEPWAITVAAAQHGRGAFSVLMSVTGPAPVPANLAPLVLNQSTGGAQLQITIPGTTPLRISAGINTANDGCAAFPANAFTGAIAVIRRGTCNFSDKINNAAAAGALAVIIANNQAGVVIPTTPGTSIPAFSVTQTEGDALRDFGNANSTTATAQITYPPTGVPNTPDALADFSGRGPSDVTDAIKPDITAPGVQILAAYAGTTLTGSEQLVNAISGTSMATPHIAGAALLVRQARPTWTVPEVKSALMMTSTETVFMQDQVTLADPNARGSGRVRVDRAINAGLVLNETVANFQAANPGVGGNPGGLNLPSLAETSCSTSCSFTRTFRNARTYGALWRVEVIGLTGTAPSLLWVPAGASRSLTVTIDASSLPANGNWNFGRLVLTELFSGAQTHANSELHLPIGVVRPVGASSAPFLPGISQLAKPAPISAGGEGR